MQIVKGNFNTSFVYTVKSTQHVTATVKSTQHVTATVKSTQHKVEAQHKRFQVRRVSRPCID